jgi:mono/diheme cytochrome c family protein
MIVSKMKNALAAAFLLAAPTWAAASDAGEGKKLVEQHRCETCHHNKTMGDASAIYLRKDRRVTTMAKLVSQVAVCNSQLNLQLFPEDEEHIVAYLNDTYYHFPARK